MMYDFRDVDATATSASRPSEAMQINGTYIEDEITGYRTLYVKGRESLSPDFETAEINSKDGLTVKNKRFPERTITVGYQLIADSAESFREAYTKLGGILNVDDAQLIFEDEQDKYFTGTPSKMDDVPEGLNAITAEFEITCFDPFKYSVIEHEAEASADDPTTVFVDYGGTHEAYPVLEADFYKEVEASGSTSTTLTGNGDCGYVAFFTEDEKVIQCGDPAEEDGTATYEKSQTLINQTFESSDSYGTAVKSLWTQNGGVLLPSDVTKAGELAMNVASYSVGTTVKDTSGTVLGKTKSDKGSPYVYYTVKLSATQRNTNSARITVTVTSALWASGSYLLKGYALTGSLYMGGSWHNLVLKKSTDSWKGTTGHTVSGSFTLTGLTAEQTSITGIKFKVTASSGGSGTLNERSCGNLAVSAYTASTPETYFLSASSYGSGTGWHAPTITRAFPADTSGTTGATDFSLTFKQKFSIGNAQTDSNQTGAFQIMCSDSAGAVVCGVRILKNKAGKDASLVLYVNGSAVYTEDIDVSYAGSVVGLGSIIKSGEKITFDVGGIKYTATDTAVKNTKATRVTIGFEQYASLTALSYNGLYWVKLVKNNCDVYQDIPNKFSANDVLEADCRKGEIYLNGVAAPQLGALGNDWESFVLKPGLNQIGAAYSAWVSSDYAPTFKVRYREAYL